MEKNAEYWIKKLDMQKHPEGGYFKEVYRSSDIISNGFLPERYADSRNASTSIYFLLKGTDLSAFHKLKSDEIWHFYEGSPLTVHVINETGDLAEHRLGDNPENNESFQIIIKAGTYFGAEIVNKDSYSLIGCTVAPGFDFRDFELAKRSNLLFKFPQHKQIIEILTRIE
jgi:uncharacterized protein